MKLTQIALLTLTSLILSGCSVFQRGPAEPNVVVKTVPIPIEIYHPPAPSPLQLENITWYVITSENYEEKIRELEQLQGGEAVVFAMTPQAYENMSYNIQELRRFIRQQNKILQYYRNVTEYRKQENIDKD